jgi:hypothetical protein
MKRIFILVMISIFLVSCWKNEAPKINEMKLSDGSIIRTDFEIKKTSAGERVFVVEYRRDKKILKEDTLEKEVLEVWSHLEAEADKSGATEGIIRARYFIEKDEKTREPVYEDFLYATEKIENGTWQIKKVN